MAAVPFRAVGIPIALHLATGIHHRRPARMVKSSTEVARLERAAQIAEDGVAAVLAMLVPGVTEREAVMVQVEDALVPLAPASFRLP